MIIAERSRASTFLWFPLDFFGVDSAKFESWQGWRTKNKSVRYIWVCQWDISSEDSPSQHQVHKHCLPAHPTHYCSHNSTTHTTYRIPKPTPDQSLPKPKQTDPIYAKKTGSKGFQKGAISCSGAQVGMWCGKFKSVLKFNISYQHWRIY